MPGRYRLSRRARLSRSPSSISESFWVASTGCWDWGFPGASNEGLFTRVRGREILRNFALTEFLEVRIHRILGSSMLGVLGPVGHDGTFEGVCLLL
jgi:hypothetical protein